MVNIIIQPHNTSCQKQDLVILEFQGGFNSSEVVDLSDVDIGNLSLNENSAELVVGHQRLLGKKVKLAKPFAAIHKRVDSMENYYDVVCIIKEKYVFFQRPALFVPENLRNLARIGRC
ncbi:hypothetical protein G6F46_006333 [Rhizopus delemar]|uniref:Uncharacterized protein n=3 Tax=Rhizopus TaxID=4842 RepID=I1CIW1_RHIO9|nr:hypothetical protein RO3G_13102 [Rhizopus delemar RA 99-880]KAG1052403.1 hypothetical protein G6F43_005455 [Rhizopus delemar]KAG1542177.1 hypothetical protein G6F51_007439 [Rhizopus arrhizus]KAG1460180.1 hypothetical protein G6F55_004320 [Rhizopus delemar]KAG1502500.1 hypothetical protein G6F54_002311 [Rhizopus delemar]|eukprot:EIE88391.1 hypothetical protein RO3G_13102 [Rhizopus delemar RA 99-880]